MTELEEWEKRIGYEAALVGMCVCCRLLGPVLAALTWQLSGAWIPDPLFEDMLSFRLGLGVDQMLKVLWLGDHVLGDASFCCGREGESLA